MFQALLLSFLIRETQQLWDSPSATVSQSLGITDITIAYHRPGVKGREVWGKLVPYGQVWRAGANQATTFSISTAAKVAGKPLAAGTYALFVLPMNDKWTFIFSKEPEQWGAYGYTSDQDALRVDVAPTTAPQQEWLRYEVEPQTQSMANISLRWEKKEAHFPIEVDVDGVYQAYLKAEVQKADASSNPKERFNTYFLAAKYWIARGERLDEGKALLDKAEKEQPSFWVDEYRARLLAKQGKRVEALAALERAKKNAKGAAPQAYIDGLDQLRKEWTLGK